MKNMTFEQFLLTYNFREPLPNDKYDTQIIRIHLPDKEDYHLDEWFEFGIYNFDRGVDILKRIKKIFNEDILKSYVYSMRTLDSGILCVDLSYEKILDMD